MQEELLHYIWKYKKFDFTAAKTTAGEALVLIDNGLHNTNSGPDFFNARLKIGGQLWAGNVEIHLKASDWYFHAHETNPEYDNVILHVVWEEDVDVFRRDNSPIPALVLKPLVSAEILQNYQHLTSGEKWINCEHDFGSFQDFQLKHWLERLFLERLEEKSKKIEELLRKSGNDWEAVLFRMLARNFGLNVNGDAFQSMAESFPFKVLQKNLQDQTKLEALLLGQSGMLNKGDESAYFKNLIKQYNFQQHKYGLSNSGVIAPKHFRLRPDNFPGLRLVQLAAVYHRNRKLFAEIIAAKELPSVYTIFDVEVSDYWKTHYNFGKEHRPRPKKLSNNFIDLLLINTIIPLKFAYSRYVGNPQEEELLELMQGITAEKNSVVEKFEQLRPGTLQNALDSQALLQLKKYYCEKNRCLECHLGFSLLQKTSSSPKPL